MTETAFKRKIVLENQTAYNVYDIRAFAREKGIDLDRLPFSIRILLENLLRNRYEIDDPIVRDSDVWNVASWQPTYDTQVEIPYYPSRVVMQDFTGVPPSLTWPPCGMP